MFLLKLFLLRAGIAATLPKLQQCHLGPGATPSLTGQCEFCNIQAPPRDDETLLVSLVRFFGAPQFDQ